MSPANPSLIPGHKFQQFRSHFTTTIWPKFLFKIVKIYFVLRELEVIFCHTMGTLIAKLHYHSQIRPDFQNSRHKIQHSNTLSFRHKSTIQNSIESISNVISNSSYRIRHKVLQQRLHQLEETGGVYSNITALFDTTIPPHTTLTCSGKTKVTVPIRQQLALIQSTNVIPTVPGIVTLSEGSNTLAFEIANYSHKPLHINKHQELATLHQG